MRRHIEQVITCDPQFRGGYADGARSTLDAVQRSDPQRHDRGFRETCRTVSRTFNVRAFFAGKVVLELGAGVDGRFGREAAEHDTTVLSLNPFWATREYQDWLERGRAHTHPGRQPKGPENPSRWFAAAAQQLPLADNCVDGIIAFNSVPMYLPSNREDYVATFAESLRVMRPDGLAVYHSIPPGQRSSRAMRDVLDEVVGPERYVWGEGNDYKTTLFVAANTVVRDTLVKGGATAPSVSYSI